MDFKQVVDLLQTQINWEAFFRLRKSIEVELNKNSERFFKSTVLERGLCRYSNGLLRYIDERGRDCQFIGNERCVSRG